MVRDLRSQLCRRAYTVLGSAPIPHDQNLPRDPKVLAEEGLVLHQAVSRLRMCTMADA